MRSNALPIARVSRKCWRTNNCWLLNYKFFDDSNSELIWVYFFIYFGNFLLLTRLKWPTDQRESMKQTDERLLSANFYLFCRELSESFFMRQLWEREYLELRENVFICWVNKISLLVNNSWSPHMFLCFWRRLAGLKCVQQHFWLKVL